MGGAIRRGGDQAARRTAAARPMSAVPTSTIAASSRKPVEGTATRWTATVAAVSPGVEGAAPATIGVASNVTNPKNVNEIICLRMTLCPSLTVNFSHSLRAVNLFTP